MLAALALAGFADTAAFSFQQDWRVVNADGYIEIILTGTVRARAVLAAQSDAAATGVRSYIADYLTALSIACRRIGRTDAGNHRQRERGLPGAILEQLGSVSSTSVRQGVRRQQGRGRQM